MSKISPEHLARGAFVYVRQSTADQLRNNHESRRRQYALAERAQMLGWSEVVVIDDDLGVSAGGVVRPGFERLLAAICAGQVGAVVSIEASRLARNGRDWHTLLEFCALVGSVIVDEDGVYDPRSVNDRLLLGMKGTMSEMELSLLRQRSAEALKLKAARGDLHTTVAIGFVRSEDDRIELDPDQRIREAIGAVFARFAQAGSVRQVLLWFRQERIELPSALYEAGRRSVVWRLPSYNSDLGKITPAHRQRGAFVYIRQSTPTQVEHNRESTERQYALADRAVELGWPREQVTVVDEDLGLSGSSTDKRSGFARLIAAVAMRLVGIVLGLEVSRLARNNADWYHLLDLCAMTDTLIGDADGLYHPAWFNDRLLLGLKGTMSEAELHIIRARLEGGIRNKAARGELRRGLPTGFIWGEEDGEVLLHPDEAVRQAIRCVFERFAELGSARRVWLWLRCEGLSFPAQYNYGTEIRWGAPTYTAIHGMLTNPVYVFSEVMLDSTRNRLSKAARASS